MRAGPDTALARVVQVFGSARLYYAYLFASKRGKKHLSDFFRHLSIPDPRPISRKLPLKPIKIIGGSSLGGVSVSRKLLMDSVHKPTTGLLGEVYRTLSSVQFNAASQRKILEHIQQDSTTESLGLPLIEVIQQRENSYLLCGSFRHYQLLRAASVRNLDAHILPAETSPNSHAVRAFRQGISTILVYDCITKTPHPQLRELKKYLKSHASPELLQLIKNDAFLKSALRISARDLRTQLTNISPLELMVKKLKTNN